MKLDELIPLLPANLKLKAKNIIAKAYVEIKDSTVVLDGQLTPKDIGTVLDIFDHVNKFRKKYVKNGD